MGENMNNEKCTYTDDLFGQPEPIPITDTKAQRPKLGDDLTPEQQALLVLAKPLPQIERDALKFAQAKQGFVELYTLRNLDGVALSWRVRTLRANGKKDIKPFCVNDGRLDKNGKPYTGQFINFEPDWSVVYPEGKGRKPFYGLERLKGLVRLTRVLVNEGEKCANIAYKLGVVAVGFAGAAMVDKTDWAPLAGFISTIWADNDEAGLKARATLSSEITAIGGQVDWIDIVPLDLPKGGAIDDWLDARNKKGLNTDLNDLQALPRTAYQTTTTNAANDSNSDEVVQGDDDDVMAQIKALAELSPVAYEQARQTVAKTLGMRASVLDKIVAEMRQELSGGTDDLFAPVEPYHEAVAGHELLAQISDVIDRHIVCEPHTTIAAALWIMFTWCIDAAQIAPIACITAPEKRCGKTQMLSLIGEMVYMPMPVSNITPAALFRSIEKWQPTLLIDEADSFLKDNEDLRGILNAGHSRKNAYVMRTVGDTHEPKPFNVWGAKALSGIGHLPETLKDRSILLELRRKLPNETRQRLRHADPMEFELIRRKLCRWAIDHMDILAAARPNLPEALNDRAQDNWEILLAIADTIGGDWSQKARHAALSISGLVDSSPSVGETLLQDIKNLFARLQVTRLHTKALLDHLVNDDDLTWSTYNRGKPLSQHQLTKRLTEYGLKSKDVRIGEVHKKGYDISEFIPLFNRYLPNTPFQTATTRQPLPHKGYSDFETATDNNVVAIKNSLQALPHKTCRVVATENPLTDEKKENSEPNALIIAADKTEKITLISEWEV